MIKIAIDSRFVLRPQRGMPTYVTQLCKILPIAMPKICFYILVNSGFKHNEEEAKYSERLVDIGTPSNVKIVDIKSSGEMAWEWFLLPKFLRSEGIDVLHMPGNRVALLTGTKQVVTFHDTMEWDQFSLFRGYSRRNTLGTNLRGLLYRIHTWINYFFGTRKAAKISTISRYSQGQLLRAFPHVRNKIGYVYHGMPEGFEIDKKNSEFECRIGVLMLGGDSDQKNARNAILAWYQLPEPIKKLHKLKIIGFSGDSDSVINTTIDELKIRNDIEIVGWVSHDEIVSCFQHSAIFLFVSKEEGFGFPLIQAMSTGTPVVTSKADVLLELSGDGAVSAPYDSPASISKAIHSLLVDSTLWTERQEHGLQRAQIFDWRSVSEFFKGVYKDVLKIKGSVE